MFYRTWIKPTQLKVSQCYGDGHWSVFEEARKKHNENICSETNKLVLRLDKLINSSANDQLLDTSGRDKKLLFTQQLLGSSKDLDKSVVEWQSDNLVKLCPYCAKQFTFARRRHHCRCCGAILCNSCSKFLEYKLACKLVKPAKLYTDPYDRIEDRLQDKDTDEMPKIRTCEDCKRLLDKRIQTIEDYYCQPSFVDFYESLRKTMAEADELIISHNDLMNQKKEATPELKDKIQDLKHSIVAKSSKLKKMADKESGKQAYLLTSINQSVGYWLKETIDSKIRRIHGFRETGDIGDGWVPQQLTSSSIEISDEVNPLLIQIRNLEEYIKQARLADRYEEVSALEESKRDLEIEYLIQKDLNIDIQEPGTSIDVEHEESNKSN